MTDSNVDSTNPAYQHEWLRAVAKVLARSLKKDPADVPDDAWTSLTAHTYDGFDVLPLYMRNNSPDEVSVPGEFPFTRGSHVSDAEEAGWGVREVFGPATEVSATPGVAQGKEINERILAALANGTTHLELDRIEPSDLAEALSGVLLDLAPVSLFHPSPALGEALIDFLRSAPSATEAGSKLSIELGASPLTDRVASAYREQSQQATPVSKASSEAPGVDLDTAVKWAETASTSAGDIRALRVNGVVFNNLGATDSQEIGLAVAAGIEYLRILTDAGLDIDTAASQLSFTLATTDDFFASMAKFRAFRAVWARVLEVVGVSEIHMPAIHAETAPAMFSQRDPFTNILRCTVAAFAAGVGGATSVLVHPFDHAIKGGMPGTRRSFAHRIARNVNLLLLEESHLGFVADPAGGSYYVESITENLADAGWKVLTDLEASGGFQAGLEDGSITALLDESYSARRTDIAHRRTKVTGINEFPNLLEKPLPTTATVEDPTVRRWARDFEELRNRSDAFLEETGSRPQIHLVPLGPLAKHNVRTGFTSNLLASGGIEAVNPGQVNPAAEDFGSTFADASIAVICGTDAEYGENAQAAVEALRSAGVGKILLAGAAKAVAEIPESSQPDGFLNMKIDAVATLRSLLDELGA